MKAKLLLASVLVAGFAATSWAQTGTGTGGVGAGNGAGAANSSGMRNGAPAEWQGTLGDAFYSDFSAGTLRSQDEIRSNWGNLSPENQAMVREHCATMDTASATGGTSTMGGPAAGTDTTTSGTDSTGVAGADQPTDTGTTASINDNANMRALCEQVGGM